MTTAFDLKDLEKRMRAAHDAFKKELGGLRTGRANAGLLEPIQVQVYGQRMPISQCGTISVPEARMLTIQVWDKAALPAVEKAIRESNLGLNPVVDGLMLRLPIPALTAERRNDLVKVAHKYAEGSKIAIRNVRREGMELLKKLEKDGKMSQDEARGTSTKVQELTDKLIKDVDQSLAAKEAEINKV